jgi:CDP-paratose 2-epimerase
MKVLITGGAGFIGCNVAEAHLQRGDDVVVFDNLSRKGAAFNLQWLQGRFSRRLVFVQGDIRDPEAVGRACASSPDRVYHFAAQVAVTTSVANPREDFEINAAGTFNLLEAVREKAPAAVVFFASTNKVYGGLEDVPVAEDETRYRLATLPGGVTEHQALDFHSPYGCSKGCADQYVRDYARIYGLRTVVFRQSCIYGTRQFGVEDQGWIAHFFIAARMGRPIMIYGNGKQVRDILWISDLTAAYEAAAQHIAVTAGQVYNIGGGPENSLSIWKELSPKLQGICGKLPAVKQADWRPGDQPIFVSDNSKALRDFGWRPKVGIEEGFKRLWEWVGEIPAELLLK